mgnify:CR=1 FL=1
MNPYTKKIEQISADWHKIDSKLKFLQRTYGREEAQEMELYKKLFEQRWELDAQEMDLELQSKIYELNANFDPSADISSKDEEYISAENLIKHYVYTWNYAITTEAKMKTMSEEEAGKFWEENLLHNAYEGFGALDALKYHYGIEIVRI